MLEQSIISKLDQIEEQYEALTSQLGSPELIGDSSRYQKTAKAHADLTEIVEQYRH